MTPAARNTIRQERILRLGDNNFFNLFSRLLSASNTDRDCDEWQVAGVSWRRQRTIQWTTLSFQVETHTLHHAARPRWTLILVHEIWWGADRHKAIRNAHWVHLAEGSRHDVLRWFSAREDELDRR